MIVKKISEKKKWRCPSPNLLKRRIDLNLGMGDGKQKVILSLRYFLYCYRTDQKAMALQSLK